MKPTTLRKRFEEKFKDLPGRWEDVAPFFHQELMALAKTMEDEGEKYTPSYTDPDKAIVEAYAEAAALIRAKAAELTS